MGVAHSYCNIPLLYMYSTLLCMCVFVESGGVGTLCPLAMRHCDS